MNDSKKNKASSTNKASRGYKRSANLEKIHKMLDEMGSKTIPWQGGVRVRMNVVPRQQKIESEPKPKNKREENNDE